MNTPPISLRMFRRRHLAIFAGLILSSLPLLCAGQVETGRWKSKTKGPFGQLAVFFLTPTASTGNPELRVIPLLGPEGHLLPDGKLMIWVGRNDGTALANASVTIRVPPNGNTLVSGTSRVTEVALQTNADGIAAVFLTAPDIPKDSTHGSNGEGGGGDPTPE